MTTDIGPGQLERYFALMERNDPGARPDNRRFGMRELFRGVPLEGRDVLDVGAGDGRVSLYAASAGARHVLALEPEAAGSSEGMQAHFDRSALELELSDRVEMQPLTLQDYDPGPQRFDVVVSSASINHLDEEACIRLHEDEAARERYRRLFVKLAGMCRPGAQLIVTDCDRHNLLGDLKIRNPLAPTVEWHKHQPPKLWAGLLESAGFRQPQIDWWSLNSLRAPGKVLLGNRLGSYVLLSVFRLVMARDGDAA